MRNVSTWKPSKFEYRNGILRASKDPQEVSTSSRFVADIVASQFESHLKEHVQGHLVDLGCGKVPLYDAYKDYITESLCVDWPASIHKNPFLDAECDLNLTLPFQNEQFDTIILSDVLEHISNPTQLYSEMCRILKPSGKVIMNVPFFYKLHETPHDYFRYTKFALLKFANDSRFKVILLHEMGGLPEVLTDLSSKLLVNIPLVGRYISIFIQWTGRLFSRSGLGKKLTAKTKEHYPLGYFAILQK
jgi:SAM-dependent methyltransferase